MKQKFGYISIIGLANAGKSTLTNYLSKNNLSIVSRKAQTTKTQVTAIITEDNYQMVIVDTPGIFKNLDPNIYTDAAMAAIIDSDIVVVMIDSAKSNLEDNFKLLQYLSDKKIQYVLALNKIDLIKKG